jgi:hypothetical protein
MEQAIEGRVSSWAEHDEALVARAAPGVTAVTG